jgi:hypothetical protein
MYSMLEIRSVEPKRPAFALDPIEGIENTITFASIRSALFHLCVAARQPWSFVYRCPH